MSGLTATGIALALYAAALLPLALAVWRSRYLVHAVGFVAAGSVCVAFLSTGLIQRDQFADREVTPLLAQNMPRTRCERALDALLEAQVIIEPAGGATLVVNSAQWDRLPAQFQEPLLACAREVRGANAGEQEVELIRR